MAAIPHRLRLAVASALLAACARGDAAPAGSDATLFTRLPASATGVRFANRLRETRELNIFTYRHFYNGGGVALGDLTGDGLPELVLTGAQTGPRVYLNLGQFRFRDVTAESGVGRQGDWATGAAMADWDGDGRLDLFVGFAGKDEGPRRANALYRNAGLRGGVPVLRDVAPAWGLADRDHATQAAPLDYDGDGDLDLFLINNAPIPVSGYGTRNVRGVRDSTPGNRLFRNDLATAGRFADVSAAAGLHGSQIAFGLGVAVSDVNRDGRPDVYVANDFFERDYLYLNRGDGTFADALPDAADAVSYFSMGMDVADVNNDGWPDVYTTDMLPEGERRFKLMTSYEGWDVYQAKVVGGYHHQLTRNMLQLNDGGAAAAPAGALGGARTPLVPTFTEVGQMAGVSRTDWSWSALLADLDLDGRKDAFVTNGLAKDITSQDYVAYLADAATMREATKGGPGTVDYGKLGKAMTSTPIADYAFRNVAAESGAGEGVRFANEARAWGLDLPSFSSGAAYGDLDGDGAPDLVVNNVDGEAFVYRNNARRLRPGHHVLRVRLDGAGRNRFGVGARVAAYAGGTTFVQEQSPVRGFQSSVDYTLTVGLGRHARLDSLVVDWPDGRRSVQPGVAADQLVTVRQADATTPPPAAPPPPVRALMADASGDSAAPRLPFRHAENAFVDFDRERLAPRLLSTEGPALAVGDVNRDGLDDVFLGGAKNQAGAVLVQARDGRFRADSAPFTPDAGSEDTGAALADVDGDGDLDLYVVSGGSEWDAGAPELQDRLYLNDGRGRFTRAPAGALPTEGANGSRVAAADYDGDGDTDLFVGGRAVTGRYGVSGQSLLLVNDGRGRFTNATDARAPGLAGAGMVTDAAWHDTDGDGRPELVLVGEWMPVTVFHNAGGGRLARQAVRGLEASTGWWTRVVAADVTGDGRADLVLGNVGLNSRLHASDREPVRLYVKDFDQNGITEQILTCYNEGVDYPVPLRDDLIRALPAWRARFPSYARYATQTVDSVLPPKERAGALVREARTFATSVARANADGSFTLAALPAEAQVAPVAGIVARDLNGDGATDLVLAGNFDGVRPEIGRLAAGRGLVLRGDGRGGFAPLPRAVGGFAAPGQTRDLAVVRSAGAPLLVAARNNDRPLVYRLRPAGAAVARGLGAVKVKGLDGIHGIDGMIGSVRGRVGPARPLGQQSRQSR